MKIDDDEDQLAAASYLPRELVIDEILTRLPARTLAKWSCVCKLWYNSIIDNNRFSDIHLMQNNKKLFLSLLNIKHIGDQNKNYGELDTCFFSLDDDCQHKLLFNIQTPGKSELVGYCNGLACITEVDSKASYTRKRVMAVANPTTSEVLQLNYSYPRTEVGFCEYLCHGFGFDSSTKHYKVVIVSTSKANDEFVCIVFTLGTNSWRRIVMRIADMSPPPGSSPFPSRMVTRASGNIRTPATLCGGDLFWRITNSPVVIEEAIISNSTSDILLSFDIHNEKIQFIRLPSECHLTAPTPTTALVVEHHLLEHRGYLCVARSEKAMRNDIDHCSSQSSFVCRCRFTVQLYMLKDAVKQVWIKGEAFGVQVRQLGLAPAPFCCHFDAATATPTALATRILSSYDQVLLYWSDGECLKFFNLHTERLEVVRSSSSSDRISRRLFERKMEGLDPSRGFGDPDMDYQLHTQAENIRSLKTFIPAGEVAEFGGRDDFMEFYRSNGNKLPAGWVSSGRKSVTYRAFY